MELTTNALVMQHTQAELLLCVDEGDRREVVFGAELAARESGNGFLTELENEVTLYASDFPEWAQRQMRRYDAAAEEAFYGHPIRR